MIGLSRLPRQRPRTDPRAHLNRGDDVVASDSAAKDAAGVSRAQLTFDERVFVVEPGTRDRSCAVSDHALGDASVLMKNWLRREVSCATERHDVSFVRGPAFAMLRVNERSCLSSGTNSCKVSDAEQHERAHPRTSRPTATPAFVSHVHLRSSRTPPVPSPRGSPVWIICRGQPAPPTTTHEFGDDAVEEDLGRSA